ncbi:MAG: hypothetical protein RMN24_06180 [Anaerolineae bacterium]|nr:hypothetical protein [Caldilineales bacterium]MCX7852379.1 hypothetical protein [Caldilineales bacterium]MDW8268741.1 hypothetical protein [Anaerolineae bacterium]
MKPITWRYALLLVALLAALSLVSCRDRGDREPTPTVTTPSPTATWPPTLAPFASPLESPPGSQP